MIVSPWISKGIVDKIVYDHTSILATLEKLLVLTPLTARDAGANDILHLLQPNMRTDTPAVLNNPVRSLSARRADTNALDDQPLSQAGNVPGFLAIHLKADLELSGDEASPQEVFNRFAKMTTVGEARAYAHAVRAKIETWRIRTK